MRNIIDASLLLDELKRIGALHPNSKGSDRAIIEIISHIQSQLPLSYGKIAKFKTKYIILGSVIGSITSWVMFYFLYL